MTFLPSSIAIVGALVAIFGWSVYRRPGVSLLAFAPIWRLPKLVLPTGVKLIHAGQVIMVVGVAMIFLQFINL